MSSLLAIVPWALFGIMVLFGMIFSVVAWRASQRAAKAEDELERLRAALRQMEQRAQQAESRIGQADQRASAAEARIGQAENEANQAREALRVAETRAGDAARRADGALAEARRADSQLQKRQADAADKAQKAQKRAESLLDWAREQWRARQETDRQRAQAVQGSFQAQLQAYLENRRAPVTFRVESEVDQLAAPLLERFTKGEKIRVDGADVQIEFPVDPSLGFRA